MGQSVSAAIEAAGKINDESKKIIDDNLQAMMIIAKAKLALFEKTVEANTNSKEVPINKIIGRMQQINAGVKSSDEKLKSEINKLVRGIVSGDFVSAFETAAGTVVDSVLGSFIGSESEQQLYKIVAGNNGSLLRLDFYVYAYKFASDTLTKVCKNIFITSMIISTVDIKALDESTIRCLVLMQYGNSVEEQTLTRCTTQLLSLHAKSIGNANKAIESNGNEKEAMESNINSNQETASLATPETGAKHPT